MNFQRSGCSHIAIFLISVFLLTIPIRVHADWSIQGLGSLGGTSSSAQSINDSGQIVGSASTASEDTRAFITGPNGSGMTDLGSFGGTGSSANAINNSGQVIGNASTATGETHVFITGPNGGDLSDLGTFGKESVFVQGMNNSGQIVGFSIVDSNFNFLAFRTGPNGVGITDMPTTLGGIQSVANAINDSGRVVGAQEFDRSQLASRAYITDSNGSGMIDLGTLGGATSSAFDINDSGQVVGRADAMDGDSHPFVTGPDGIGMMDLGTLGGSFGFATDINNGGEVVGFAGIANNEATHAFLYSHGGITDLSLLDVVISEGWTNITARDINNHGQIVGFGTNAEGNQEAFLLSYTPDTLFNPQPIYIPPVPEPGSYLMLLAGLGLLGFVTLRRKEMET